MIGTSTINIFGDATTMERIYNTHKQFVIDTFHMNANHNRYLITKDQISYMGIYSARYYLADDKLLFRLRHANITKVNIYGIKKDDLDEEILKMLLISSSECVYFYSNDQILYK